MSIPRIKFYMYIGFGVMGIFLLLLAGSESLTHSRHFASNFLTSLFMTMTGLGLCVFSLTTLMLRDDPDVWR